MVSLDFVMEPVETAEVVTVDARHTEPGAASQTLESMIPEGEGEGDAITGNLEDESALVLHVGDFVWGKKKSNLWWPGRVRDPSADHAKNEGASLLVHFFGDNSVSWCQPSQLRPFAEDFTQMVNQNSSKGFVAAVGEALAELEHCLLLKMEQNSCAEESSGFGEKEDCGRFSATICSPQKLLELVTAAAQDLFVVDILEIAMLRSWVIAFARGGGHQRQEIADLVDKIDLDASPCEWADDEDVGVEDCGDGDGAVVTKQSVTGRKHRPRKKQKSMAKLIAEMDLNVVDVDELEEAPEGKNEVKDACIDVSTPEDEDDADKTEMGGDNKDSALEIGDGEGTISGKRDRKKSKYLSPPYTHLSGGLQVVDFGKSEKKTPGNSSQATTVASIVGSPTTVQGSSSIITEEEDLKSPVSRLDRTSMYEIQSEFLAVARDVFHLKWNRLAKLMKWLFAMHRSSSYSDGAQFEAHQKHLAESSCHDTNSVYNVMGMELKGKGMASKSKKRKKGLSGETTTDSSRKRRSRKKNAVKENQAPDLGQEKLDGYEAGKVSAVVIVGETAQSSDFLGTNISEASVFRNGAVDNSQRVKLTMRTKRRNAKDQSDSFSSAKSITGLKRKMRKNESIPGNANPADANGWNTNEPKQRRKHTSDIQAQCVNNTQTNMGLEMNFLPANDGLDQKKRDEVSNLEKALVSAHQVPNGSEEVKTTAALIVTFAPGVPLPSKDDLCSTFNKYGELFLDESELQEDARCAVVVFASSADAEKATKCTEKTGVFAPPNATYHLHCIRGNADTQAGPSVPKPPLSYIRKNLERMISTLAESSLKEEAVGNGKENLVGEMQGLLEKVKKMLASNTPL